MGSSRADGGAGCELSNQVTSFTYTEISRPTTKVQDIYFSDGIRKPPVAQYEIVRWSRASGISRMMTFSHPVVASCCSWFTRSWWRRGRKSFDSGVGSLKWWLETKVLPPPWHPRGLAQPQLLVMLVGRRYDYFWSRVCWRGMSRWPGTYLENSFDFSPQILFARL